MDPVPISADRRRNPLIGCFQGCLVLLTTFALSVLLMGGMIAVVFEFSPFSAFSGMPVGTVVEEIALSSMADLGEEPAVTPAKPAPRYPIDPSVPQPLVVPLVKALDLMRGTPEGAALFKLLVDNDVLISVESLPYNAGYTSSSWTRNGWKESNIVIDADAVRSRDVDVLAAILVHEATHAKRAIDETACFYKNDCQTLPNGVDIQEEVYAHAAEARFWQELYGNDGKNFAFGTASGENELLKAYRKGSATFNDYVRKLRGDSREGEGVQPG